MRWILLSLSVLTLASCADALSEVDGSTQVECTNDAQCPTGSRCVTEVQRCVADNSGDTDPPNALSVALEPAQARLGDTVVLRFDSSEPLIGDPIVLLGSGDPMFLAEGGTDRSALRYEYRFIVTASATDGTLPIAVTLVDSGGNRNTATVAELVVDSVPPSGEITWALAAGQSALPLTRPSGFSIQGDADTTLSSLELIRGDASAVDVLSSSSIVDGGNGAFTGALDLEMLGVNDGQSVSLRAILADGAGNLSLVDAIRTAQIGVDGTLPSDVSAMYVGVEPIQSRDVAIQVAALGATEVWLEGDLVDDPAWIPVAFPATRLVTLSAGAGSKTIRYRVRDGAQNTTELQTLSLALVDTADMVGPQVLSVTATDPSVIDVAFDEPVDPASAELISAYTLTKIGGFAVPPPAIIGTAVDPGGQVVTLFLDGDLVGADTYRLEVTGVRDLFQQLQDPDPSSNDFNGFGPAPDTTPPTIIAPLFDRQTVERSPLLVWSARVGATSYDVQLSAEPDFSDPIIDMTIEAPTTLVRVPMNLDDETYHWRVRSDVPTSGWRTSTIEIIHRRLLVSAGASCSPCYGNQDKPFPTVAQALEASSALDVDEVQVRGGATYDEFVTLRSGVDLLGGYNATFTARDPELNVTTLTASTNPIAVAAIGVTEDTQLDGFSIQANDSPVVTGLLISASDSSLTISNNTISVLGDGVLGSDGVSGESTAIDITLSGSFGSVSPLEDAASGPRLFNNRIIGAARGSPMDGDDDELGFALIIRNASPLIEANEITGRTGDDDTIAVQVRGSGSPVFTNNLIRTESGSSLFCVAIDVVAGGSNSDPARIELLNNTAIANNCTSRIGPNSRGLAVRLGRSIPILKNNLFVQLGTGGACLESSGLALLQGGTGTFENNGYIGCGTCWLDNGFDGCTTGSDTSVFPLVANEQSDDLDVFVSSGTDFRLSGSAPSWARTGGANLGVSCGPGQARRVCVTDDLDGNARTAGYSRGAYEF